MNLKTKLQKPHRLDQDELTDAIQAAESALRSSGKTVPARGTNDDFQHAAQLAALLPDDATAPTASAGADALVAEYQRVQHDPVARAEYFAKHETAVVRAIEADRRSQVVSRQAAPEPRGAELLAQYEKVRHDPTERARFLARHDKELTQLMN
jgi:hypothetical protein